VKFACKFNNISGVIRSVILASNHFLFTVHALSPAKFAIDRFPQDYPRDEVTEIRCKEIERI